MRGHQTAVLIVITKDWKAEWVNAPKHIVRPGERRGYTGSDEASHAPVTNATV